MHKVVKAEAYAREIAAAVKALYFVSGVPVQQNEVSTVLDMEKTTVWRYSRLACQMGLITDIQATGQKASRFVPGKAPTPKKVRKAKNPYPDIRLGFLF